jgi:hypothetical protein
MEDGAVSIFGLVFGVAASAPDATTVLLTGATRAAAAAVPMMAGRHCRGNRAAAWGLGQLRVGMPGYWPTWCAPIDTITAGWLAIRHCLGGR